MTQKRPRPASRATPAQSRRPVGPMPREVRAAPAPPSSGAGGQTLFGRSWPIPVAPWVVGLALLLALAAGGAWYFEGRFETTPAEAAKRLLPYKADEVQKVVVTSPAGSVTFNRDAGGAFSSGGPPPTPTAVPSPQAPPPAVVLPPSTKLEGTLGQLNQMTIDRVLLEEPSRSAEFGLDAPQLTLELTPKRGAPAAIAIGGQNPDGSAYYVRRDGPGGPRDTVLVTRYTLDDLMKVAGELIAEQGASRSAG